MPRRNAGIQRAGRGGARPGAGRKRGSGAVQQQMLKFRELAHLEGTTPLQVMLRAMREHLQAAIALDGYDREAWELVASSGQMALWLRCFQQMSPIDSVVRNTMVLGAMKSGHGATQKPGTCSCSDCSS